MVYRSIPSIIRNGSMKSGLHELSLCLALNQFSGTASIYKLIGFQDSSTIIPMLLVGLLILTIGVCPLDFFDHNWGPHTVDSFANSNNHKLSRLYPRHWNPGVEGVDAFFMTGEGRITG